MTVSSQRQYNLTSCASDFSCLTPNARCLPGIQAAPNFIPSNNLLNCLCDPWPAWQGGDCTQSSSITVGLTIVWSLGSILGFCLALLSLADLVRLCLTCRRLDELCYSLVVTSLALLSCSIWLFWEAYRINVYKSENNGGETRAFWGVTGNFICVAFSMFLAFLANLNLALVFVEILTKHPSELSPMLSRQSTQAITCLQLLLVIAVVVACALNSVTGMVAIAACFTLIVFGLFAYSSVRFHPLALVNPRMLRRLFLFMVAATVLDFVIFSLLLARILLASSPLAPTWTQRPAQLVQIAFEYAIVFELGVLAQCNHESVWRRIRIKAGESSLVESSFPSLMATQQPPPPPPQRQSQLTEA